MTYAELLFILCKAWEREAVIRLQDGTNNFYSSPCFDVRRTPYDHPQNL